MMGKKIILIFLLSETLQILASDNYGSEIMNNNEFHIKEMKHIHNDREEYEEKKFKKDTIHWDKKKYMKEKANKNGESNIHIKLNEIESNEYIDKYNKYGNTFNPEIAKIQYKLYQKKRALDKEKHDMGNKEVPNLLHDTDVNYKNNIREIAGDSELLTDKKERKNKEDYLGNYQNNDETYLKRYKKDYIQSLSKIDLSNPPPANETILMARYIVHTVDWAALATLSARASTKGAPFVCVKATSDGMKNESSGVPFFYMSPMDLCTQDLQKDNRVSVLVTLSETEYCTKQNLDPQDPRCAKLTLSGKIKKLKPGSAEETFARNALFSRHPAMKSWPADHNWYFTKLKIGQIILLDQYGGATYIKVKDYLNGKIVDSVGSQK